MAVVRAKVIEVDVKTGEIVEVEKEIEIPDEEPPQPQTAAVDAETILNVLKRKGIITDEDIQNALQQGDNE
jgi:predicted deacylase